MTKKYKDWAYTIRIGRSEEHDEWVAQVSDDLDEEVYVTHGENPSLVLGQATAAVMEVLDEGE